MHTHPLSTLAKGTALAALMALAGCKPTAKTVVYDIDADKEAINAELDSILHTDLSEEEQEACLGQMFDRYYRRHLTDSLGLELFATLASISWEPEQIMSEYEEADTLIQNNARVKHYVKLAKAQQLTAPGNDYIDIVGPDAITGQEISVSQTLALGRPVLLDFWASWCPPCKQYIKTGLSEMAKKYEGRLSILGIDVWERQRADLDSIMPTLPITWPVIYTGGRDSSPADDYGVPSIPTLVLIGTDGKIIARGHTEVEEEVKKLLGE